MPHKPQHPPEEGSSWPASTPAPTKAHAEHQQYEMTPLGRLHTHPENPRRGDVDAIRESIQANGFYGAVVAQRSTGYILAGNHRYLAARSAGLTQVPVLWVECDAATAKRIMLADNRTNDLAAYDDPQLLALLESIRQEAQAVGDSFDAALLGTGYLPEDFDALVRSLGDEALTIGASLGVAGSGPESAPGPYNPEGALVGPLSPAVGAPAPVGAPGSLGPQVVQMDEHNFTKNPTEKIDTYNSGSLRQIMLVMGAAEYEVMLSDLRAIAQREGLDTNVEVVSYLIEQYKHGMPPLSEEDALVLADAEPPSEEEEE